MKLSEYEPQSFAYAPLASDVLAVISTRVDGWCIYVGAVPGKSHDREWDIVAYTGDKQSEKVAMAIASACFGIDTFDLPYAR